MPLVAAIAGLGWGFLSDRIAARWPAHDDGAVRPVDWRTPLVAIIGAVAGGLWALRFSALSPASLLFAAVVLALVLLFATDLDQRLLPDVVTLPLAAVALLAFAAGVGPYVRTPADLLLAVVAAIGVPLALYALSIPFGAGAIGIGDLKLLFGFGLLVGPARLIGALVLGAIVAAIAIVVLLAARRITLRTYIPYGPFLIVGALWAALRSNL